MDDYTDAYLTQFTTGCGCPYCQHKECFSSSNFIYKNYSSEQLEELASKLSGTKSRLCPNLSPTLVDPSIFEDLIYFSDFASSIISDELEIDFDIFDKFLDSPELFGLSFSVDNESDYSNFSFDEDKLIKFLTKIVRKTDTQKYQNKLIELSAKIFNSPNLKAPYIERSILLLSLFLSLFKINKIKELNKFFELNSLSDQFYVNILYFPNLAKMHVNFFQDIITVLCKTEVRRFELCPKVRGMVAHIEKIAQKNRIFNFPLERELFKNEEVSAILNRELQIRYLLTNRPSFLDFRSFVSLNFKREVQKRISHLIMEARIELNFFESPLFVISVKRDSIVEQTFQILNGASEEQLQRPLKINFVEEKGRDSGGLSREFFHLLSLQILPPKYGFFEKVNDDRYLWFNRFFPDVAQFRTIGIMVALALHNSMMLPIRFPILIFKKLLDYPLTLVDLHELKPDLATNLRKTLRDVQNGSFDVATLDLRFETTTVNSKGQYETVELIKNGSEVPVTNDNFEQYIYEVLNWELVRSVEKQFNEFKNGFFYLFKIKKAVEIFEPEEFDLIISGQTVYNWEELKMSTLYTFGYKADSLNIRIFWKVFDGLTQEQKIEFLMFATGSKRVPINGLRDINLIIQKTTDVKMLPVAHTCAGILQLPDYCDEELMRRNLLICIQNNTGFELI